MKHKIENKKIRRAYEDIKASMSDVFQGEEDTEEQREEKYTKLLELKAELDQAKIRLDEAESTDPYRNSVYPRITLFRPETFEG